MKPHKLITIGLVLLLTACFTLPTDARVVRGESIWFAISDLNSKREFVKNDEEFRELVTNIYFEHRLSELSVSERTAFALEAFNSEYSLVISEFLVYILGKYGLNNVSHNILELKEQQIIEKEVKVKQILDELTSEESHNLDFAADIIFGLLPEQVINEVVPKYDIGEVSKINKLEGGFLNKPLILETTTGKYVLREERVHTSPENIDSVDSVTKRAREGGWVASEILYTSDGQKYVEYKGRKFTVSKYGEGYVLSWTERISKERLINIAQTLANFHKIMEGFTPEGSVDVESINNTTRKRQAFDDAIARIQALVPEERNEVESFILENYDFVMEQLGALESQLGALNYNSLPKMVIHGDYARKNVILQGDEVRLVIDWDRLSLRETRVYDVVWAMFSFAAMGMENVNFIDNEGTKYEDAILFLQAYQQVNPLTEDEIKMIPEVYKAILLEFFSWTNRPDKQISMLNPVSLYYYKDVIDVLKNLDAVNWEKLLLMIEPQFSP